MLCKDALELVEAIAAGDVQMSDGVRAHVETCPRCAGRLASARRLEALLRSAAPPPLADGFTPAVLQRIRRDRWRSEQHVDRLFNLAIAAALLLVTAGIATLLNVDALFTVSASGWALLRENMAGVMRDAAPTLVTYTAAAGLLASAIVMWWWAERRWQY